MEEQNRCCHRFPSFEGFYVQCWPVRYDGPNTFSSNVSTPVTRQFFEFVSNFIRIKKVFSWILVGFIVWVRRYVWKLRISFWFCVCITFAGDCHATFVNSWVFRLVKFYMMRVGCKCRHTWFGVSFSSRATTSNQHNWTEQKN